MADPPRMSEGRGTRITDSAAPAETADDLVVLSTKLQGVIKAEGEDRPCQDGQPHVDNAPVCIILG